MAYTFGTTVSGSIDSVRETVTAALAEEGFGILSTIDVAATLKAKLDIDGDPYIILGACNPSLAHSALEAESDIGALLPCNVVLRQEGDRIAVRVMDPDAVLGIVGNPVVDEAGRQAKEKLQRVVASLS